MKYTPNERLQLKFGMEGSEADWLFHLKPRAISLTVDSVEVFTFDREGRPYAAFVDGKNYRRGLDGRLLEKYSEEEEGREQRQRRFLEGEEKKELLERVYHRVGELDVGRLRFDEEPSTEMLAEMRRWVGRMQKWDVEELAEDERRFHEIYRTVSILPPDQYMALVVQTSEGCPWNRCTFCDLYRDRPYRVKDRQGLRAHLEAIRDFLGEGIRLRRSVFVGDANMLTVPYSTLLDAFEQVGEVLGRRGAFYGFTDVFGTRRHWADELEGLQRAGLRRLYVGLETGSDGLLKLLNKPGSAAEAVGAVRAIRRAGIGVGVIVLLGLGGHSRARAHAAETVKILNEMALGKGDMVYFSPLVAHAHGEYSRQVAQKGFWPMAAMAMREQRERMEAELRFGEGKPHTSIYDIRDFIY